MEWYWLLIVGLPMAVFAWLYGEERIRHARTREEAGIQNSRLHLEGVSARRRHASVVKLLKEEQAKVAELRSFLVLALFTGATRATAKPKFLRGTVNFPIRVEQEGKWTKVSLDYEKLRADMKAEVESKVRYL